MHEIQYVYDDRAEEQQLVHTMCKCTCCTHWFCNISVARDLVCVGYIYQHCRFIEQLTQTNHSNIVHTYIHTIIQHNSAYCLLLVYVCTVLSPAPTDRQCILLLLRQYLEGQLLLCMI